MRLLIILTMFLFSDYSIGSSFKCSSGATHVEWMICTDLDLGAMDEKLVKVYSTLKSKLNDERKKSLLSHQRAWLKKRNTECSSVYKCMRSYQERIIVLHREIDREEFRKNLITENSSHRIYDRYFESFTSEYFEEMKSRFFTKKYNMTRREVAQVILGAPEPFIRKGNILVTMNSRHQSHDEKGIMVINTDTLEAIFGVIHYLDENQNFSESAILTILYKDETFMKEHEELLKVTIKNKVNYSAVKYIKVKLTKG